MPYSVEANAIAEFIIKGRLYGQSIFLTLHYIRDPDDGTTILDGGDAINNLTSTINSASDGILHAWSVYASHDMKFETVQGQWIYPLRYAYTSQVAAITQGALSEPSIPQNLAAVITMQSDYGKRSGRGDKHIAGLGDSQYDAGYITAPGKSHLAFIADQINQNITYTDSDSHLLFPIVYHRAAPAISRLYTHFKIQETVRTMNRRTVGRGI